MDFARDNKLPRTYKYEQNKQFWPSFTVENFSLTIETSWLYTIFVSHLSLWAELISRPHLHMFTIPEEYSVFGAEGVWSGGMLL